MRSGKALEEAKKKSGKNGYVTLMAIPMFPVIPSPAYVPDLFPGIQRKHAYWIGDLQQEEGSEYLRMFFQLFGEELVQHLGQLREQYFSVQEAVEMFPDLVYETMQVPHQYFLLPENVLHRSTFLRMWA